MPAPVSVTRTTASPRGSGGDTDLPAGRRELRGIREQVADNLLDADDVGLDPYGVRVGVETDVIEAACGHHRGSVPGSP